LEAQKLSIRQRELKLEELELANKRLQMLLSTNEEDVDPEVWIIMKEQKKNYSGLYLLLRHPERFCYICARVLLRLVETIYLSSFKKLFLEHYLFGRTSLC
jgi:3-deoxy-D-manno-octulosonic-acid transferase